MSKYCNAMVLVEPNKFEQRELPIPEVGSEDMLLKVEMVGICGTDRSIFLGKHEKKNYPKLLGHEVVGRVAKIGETAKKKFNVKIGDRVTVEPPIACNECWYCLNGYAQLCVSKTSYGTTRGIDEYPYVNGAYSEYLFVQQNSKFHVIEESVPLQAACMSSVIGNGVRWVITKGKTKRGDIVTIIGPGAQGLSSTIVAKSVGASKIIVVGLEKDMHKLETAKLLGATHTLIVGRDDIKLEVEKITNNQLSNIVVDCTGAESALDLATDLVKPLGKIVVIGKNGGKAVPVITDKVVKKEIEIIGGYGIAGDMEYAVELINSNQYQVEKIVSHIFNLNNVSEAMELFVHHPDQCIRVALTP